MIPYERSSLTATRAMVPLLICGAVCAACPGAETGKKHPCPAPRPPLVALVEDGRPRCTIVARVERSAIEAHAIQELTDYVRRMTGAELPVAAQACEDNVPIYLGAAARSRLAGTEWKRLGRDGFVLQSSPAGILIAGAEDLGTLFGVYQLLEKHLGVRWFMPGKLGEVVPQAKSLAVGSFDERQTPAFRVRWIEDGDWALHQKMNVAVTVDGKPVGVNWRWSFHTHFFLVQPEKYYDQHPDWFALIRGQRKRPAPSKQGQQLCTSNPQLIEQMARNIVALFDADPSINILALSPQDGGGFCQCDACRALDENRPPEEAWHATYSRRLAIFNNEVARGVARKYPDKLLKVGAYAMYLRVPQDAGYRPEPNLAVQVCHTYSCNSHPIAAESCRGNSDYFRKELERWASLTPHVFIYEYYNKGAWGGLPYWQVHLIRQDIPYYHRLGAEGFYTQAAGRRWPACGLNHYIAAKLLWDVDLDVDRLLEDYYEKFYAEAAGPMRDYGQALQRAFAGYGPCMEPFGWRWTTLVVPEIFTPAALAAMDDAVGHAERAASSDVVRQRVALIRLSLDFTKQVMHYLTTIRAPLRSVDPRDKQALVAAQEKAASLGEPLSRDLRRFCKEHGLEAYDRLVDVHRDVRFLIDLPDRKPVLR